MMKVLLVESTSTLGSGIRPLLAAVALSLRDHVLSSTVLLDLPLLLDVQVAAVGRNTCGQLRLGH